MATQKFSRAAYERLRAELDDLSTRGRIEVAEKIERAREEGDLSENAGYHAAKDEQGHMEGRIRQLEHMLGGRRDRRRRSSCTPILYDGDSPEQAERYVVGHLEEQVDGRRRDQRRRAHSAACSQGATEGQEVTYQAPNGALKVTVLKVEPV